MGVSSSKVIRGEDRELEVSVCQEENIENVINEGHVEEELEQTLNLPEHEHSFSTEEELTRACRIQIPFHCLAQ